ncbi:N-acetylmuramoyl-L-alanine amidase family protein [Hyphomonas johnsonii]|uniref:N-acetylmuramoyl-L-alanine amidase n=1 Tax=Hyphomonas johnsonii MHS-2 TaxID=1280950 RepID=A0A059FJK1_9PROT|nr:N-acetylmuramoyl-L-alanine amidase [Hyphomonas johnsonii]KCZ90814.1 N-acetylmuramoyl-L-alanine amidase [Hyphomonas johnsonii MHS-2]
MTLFRLILLTLACICTGFFAQAEISDVRIVGNGEPTRITVWSDTAQDAGAFLAQSGGQRSLIVPLEGEISPRVGKGAGGVETWALSSGRLSFALDRPLMVSRVLNLPPTGSATSYRVIIDLETVSPARFASTAKRDMQRLARAESDSRKATYALAAAEITPPGPLRPSERKGDHKYVIVVDAGHGGKDPGTQSARGLLERDVTLKAALYLKDILEKDDRYVVRLTRDDDTFIELEDRVTLARNWGADLFISLHADAAGSPDVAGASVYTISERGERRIDKEADKNDWKIPVETGASKAISGILVDLVKRETKSHSAAFAELLLPELAAAGPVLRGTHRNAGFYVLLAPDVPAVLLEMGFLTNTADAKRLQSTAGRARTMQAVKRGIDKFFDRQEVIVASD